MPFQQKKETTMDQHGDDLGCCCAHLTVVYSPIDNGDGTMSPRWECSCCHHEFHPEGQLNDSGYLISWCTCGHTGDQHWPDLSCGITGCSCGRFVGDGRE